MDGSNSIKPSGKCVLNKTNKNTLIGVLVGSVMNLATYPKNAKTHPSNANQFDNTIQDQTMKNSFRNS